MIRPSPDFAAPKRLTPKEYIAIGAAERGDPKRAMSRSDLREFSICPHRWRAGYKDEPSKSMDWGSLIDCLFLTPDEFEHRYAIAPETYPSTPKRKGDDTEDKPWNWNANFCKDWRDEKEAAGFEVVAKDKIDSAIEAVKRLKENETAFDWAFNSHKQVNLCVNWHDGPTGLIVPVKCLVDVAPLEGNILGDLKTSASGQLRAWKKDCFAYWYHVQAALYLDAWNAVTGEDRDSFRHIVQENYPPFEVSLRLMSLEFIQIGRNTYQNTLGKYCQCLKTGVWPGYSARMTFDGWQLTEPEPWMILADVDDLESPIPAAPYTPPENDFTP